MKIYLANSSKQAIGGGWSWIANFRKGMGEAITSYEHAGVYLIPSPTMVQREEVEQAKRDGKKIVLRLDNVVRNSRNRNTGMPRMKDFAEWADLVIYQSNWARSVLSDFTGVQGAVIHNSVDESIFHDKGREWNDHTFGYARYSRDETKNWEFARQQFSDIWRIRPNTELWIIGQYSPELIDGKFDFFMGEKYRYLGVQDAQGMAELYRNIDWMMIPYLNDACSNTLIESLVSGCKLAANLFLRTGGTPELIDAFNNEGKEYFALKRMCDQYKEAISVI